MEKCIDLDTCSGGIDISIRERGNHALPLPKTSHVRLLQISVVLSFLRVKALGGIEDRQRLTVAAEAPDLFFELNLPLSAEPVREACGAVEALGGSYVTAMIRTRRRIGSTRKYRNTNYSALRLAICTGFGGGQCPRSFGIFPGQQELEDDLKDHWHSRTHKAERLRLVHRLLNFAEEKKTRVTLLSGDVHVGAVGVIESQRAGVKNNHANIINQLTSSGIVHPAPPALMSFALDFLSRDSEQVDRSITASLIEFPGTRRRFIMARNWLGLEPDGEDTRIWVNWYVEGEDDPYSKAIHSVRA